MPTTCTAIRRWPRLRSVSSKGERDSTLAQIGYLFLMFPLALSAGSTQLESAGALAAGLLQTISHVSER